MNDELEEIKQRKLAELQKQQMQKHRQEAELQQQIDKLEAFVKIKLTKEAISRYGNIKAAHPEIALQLLLILAQLMQTQPVEKIDDNELKQILQKIIPEKRETKITYR